MIQTGRPGLSREQKAELWRRWKAGETLRDIGRALGKHAASVFAVGAALLRVTPSGNLAKNWGE